MITLCFYNIKLNLIIAQNCCLMYFPAMIKSLKKY